MEKPDTRRFTPRTLTVSLTVVVLVFFALNRSAEIVTYLEHFLAVAMPLLLGMAIAYLLNLPMRTIERFPGPALARALAATVQPDPDRAGDLLVLAAILALVVPQVVASISDLSSRLPSLLAQTQTWINQTTADHPWLNDLASTLKLSSADLLAWFLALLQGQGGSWLNSTVNWLASAFGWVVSLILSLIFAIYLLLAKEKLQRQSGGCWMPWPHQRPAAGFARFWRYPTRPLVPFSPASSWRRSFWAPFFWSSWLCSSFPTRC
jgi:predicted PurR-regulated permease PerM